MSYNYTAAVDRFTQARRHAAHARQNGNDDATESLQRAVDALADLSVACPLTPLLWIHYAAAVSEWYGSLTQSDTVNDSAATKPTTPEQYELELQTLQLGVTEFPGSALLHVRTVVVQASALSLEMVDSSSLHTLLAAIQTALVALSCGHRHEDYLVVVLYRLWSVVAGTGLQQAHASANSASTSANSTSVNTSANTSTSIDEWKQSLWDCWVQRSRCPMREANQSLSSELDDQLRQLDVVLLDDPEWHSALRREMDMGRRWEAQECASFVSWEDRLEQALHDDGMLVARLQPEFNVPDSIESDIPNHRWTACWSHIDWTTIVQSNQQTYSMGLGSMATAHAIVRYVRSVQEHSSRAVVDVDTDDTDVTRDTTRHQLQFLLSLYERGVAECPCVEYLWLTYLRDMQQWSRRYTSMMAWSDRYQQVCARAVRNCPYSVPLLQHQVGAVLHLVSLSHASASTTVVVDPDQLLDVVQKGIDLGFITDPQSHLELYETAIRVVKRRILGLLAGRPPAKTKGPVYFDDGEALVSHKKNKATSAHHHTLTDDDTQELHDLLDDLPDMYHDVETRLRQATPSTGTERMAQLWRERAETETYLVRPLHRALKDPSPETGDTESSLLVPWYEQSIRAHNPPHPDVYAAYIQHYQTTALAVARLHSPVQVMVRLRRVRGLFEAALGSVGPGGSTARPYAPRWDYHAALQNLCHQWLEFERIFGSDRSLGKATKAIEKKLLKTQRASHETRLVPPLVPPPTVELTETETDATLKRALNGDESAPPTKRAKTIKEDSPEEAVSEGLLSVEQSVETAAEPAAASAAATKQTPIPKVRIGKMEYPAHPFTVRVSNLSLECGDMDLIDVFRPKCGAIVHAKIIRDKHGGGQSMGWGLIQFERTESVDMALSLHDTLGIHEKLVHVDRSHVPAVNLVPPGMHRVRPKGEGKVSKRNEKRRERHQTEKGAGHGEDQSLVNLPTSTDRATESDPKVHDVVDAREHVKPATIPTKSLLAFRPRTVARGNQHPKARLQLDGKP